MTYYSTYSFTAFTEADLFGGGHAQPGASFTVPSNASICIEVCDNDTTLSGDSVCNEEANDQTGQRATIEGAGGELGNGGQIYAESFYWVTDGHNWFRLIEIEQEGISDDYFAFDTSYGLPDPGTSLSVHSRCNVTSDWIKYDNLDAGPKAPVFVECDDPNAVKIDFEGLAAGTVVGDQFPGVTIRGVENDAHDSATDNDAMVFDSANPTGGDTDLGTSGQGNILIISEDDDGSDPDDSFQGGSITFDFAAPASVFDIKVIDTEEGGTIKLFDASGALIKTVDIPSIGDGEVAQVMIDTDGVSSMELTLNGSGAIDDLCYVPAQTGTVTGTVFCDTDCDGLSADITTIPGETITVEAEDMLSAGFKTVHGANASGGDLVKLESLGGPVDGVLQTSFSGPSGTYDIKIRVQDENDGQSKIWVRVDDRYVEAFVLDRDINGGGSNNGHFTTYVIQDVPIETGQNVRLEVDGRGCEFARIDKIDFVREPVTTTVSEPVKEGVTIKLIDANGNVVATTKTDADGNYTFDDVPEGDYTIMGVAPDGTEFTIQDAGSNDNIDSDVNADGVSNAVTVVAGGTVDVDLGLKEIMEGSLSGQYFCDTDGNGVDDGAADPGIAGVLVTLTDAGGATVATTTTGADGSYSFGGLAPGDYDVTFTDPDGVLEGKALVAPNQGDDAVDSDAVGDTDSATISNVTVVAGENTPNNDAGAVMLPAALGDKVFFDTNGNGQQDTGEAGVADVAVTLTGAGADGIFGTGDDTTANTTTDGAGMYLFDGLAAGDYRVTFTAPDTLAFTDANTGPDASDSDADPATGQTGTVTLAAGETNLTVDAGLVSADPVALDDTAKFCADETVTIDALANDTDDQPLTITQVDGQDIVEGQTVEVGGPDGVPVLVTLSGGQLVVDGEDAYAALDIGDEAMQSISYTVSDGLGGSAMANLDLTFCGDANSLQSLCDSLPETATLQLKDENAPAGTSDAAFTIKVSDTDARIEGVFEDAYCLAIFDSFDAVNSAADIDNAPAFDANIYCAVAEELPAGVLETVGINGQTAAENLDVVNWILNQDFSANGFTDAEVQGAIWALTDGEDLDSFGFTDGIFVPAGAGDAADAQQIVDLALANGEGFVAGSGDLVGIIIDPNDPAFDQPFIYAVAFEEIDCLC